LAEKFPNLYNHLQCRKCGLSAIEYKCDNCGYTPHVYESYLGEANKKASDLSSVGYLETWRCLKCGRLKTIRRGGSFSRMG